MNKKAFTLVEIVLVTVLISIFVASGIPYMLKYLGGFNKITNQGVIVQSLQEISTVINRRIISDKETASLEHLNEIINSYATKQIGNYYELSNGTIIKKLTDDDVKTCSYTKNGNKIEIPNCIRITLTASKNGSEHRLSFILFPAI